MAKDSQFNLFDPGPKKTGSSPVKKTVSKPLPPKRTLTPQAIVEKAHASNDQEIISMVERIQSMQKDLETKVSNLKEKIPITYASIAKFLNDKENFPPEQWAMIQDNREALEKKFGEMVGKDAKKVKEKRLEEKGSKEFRSKSLGSRRNWIPIR